MTPFEHSITFIPLLGNLHKQTSHFFSFFKIFPLLKHWYFKHRAFSPSCHRPLAKTCFDAMTLTLILTYSMLLLTFGLIKQIHGTKYDETWWTAFFVRHAKVIATVWMVQGDLPESHILALNYDEVKRRRDLSLLMYLSCVRLRGTSCGLRL